MIWTRDESKERFPEALSPLGWSVLQSALDVNLESIRNEFYLKKLRKDQVSRWIDGYLYSGKDFFKRIPLYHFSLLAILGLCLRSLLSFVPALLSFNRKESFKVRWLKRVYQNEFKTKIQKTIYDWQNELPKHLKNFDDNTLTGLTWQPKQTNFIELMQKIENDGCAYNRLDFAIYFYKNLLKGMLETIARWKNESISIADLTGQSPFKIGRHINHLLSEGSLLVDEQHVLAFVSQRIGHLSLSWDIAQPTFSEKSDLIKKMISEKKEYVPISLLARNGSDNEMASQFIQLVACDDQHRFYASYQFPTIRSVMYKIADEWMKYKLLNEPNDLFFLTLDEVTSWHKQLIQGAPPTADIVAAIVAQRKSYISIQPANDIDDDNIELRDTIFYTRKQPGVLPERQPMDSLVGVPASPGKASGYAFWVTDYDSLQNCPVNAIVLCQTPSPNFHNAFVKSIAIVSESGGLLSHGAIIARELQLPCLLQVVNLKTLKNGDLIEVDAIAGTIKRLS